MTGLRGIHNTHSKEPAFNRKSLGENSVLYHFAHKQLMLLTTQGKGYIKSVIITCEEINISEEIY